MRVLNVSFLFRCIRLLMGVMCNDFFNLRRQLAERGSRSAAVAPGDYGISRPSKLVALTGNTAGLPEIRERAKRIEGRFDIWSETGAGTEIQLTLPASKAYAQPQAQQRFGLFRKKTDVV